VESHDDDGVLSINNLGESSDPVGDFGVTGNIEASAAAPVPDGVVDVAASAHFSNTIM
jgi:hypothetical protein